MVFFLKNNFYTLIKMYIELKYHVLLNGHPQNLEPKVAIVDRYNQHPLIVDKGA